MRTSGIVGVVVGTALVLAALFTGTAAAATKTIEFEELEKGATFAYVDNAPKAELKHGFPTSFSAGDQIAISTPLVEGSKRIGRLASSCTATTNAKSFDKAGFVCQGTFILGNGTLVASAVISGEKGTEGAVVGGTGAYANARGTFVSKEGKGRSKVTISLVE